MAWHRPAGHHRTMTVRDRALGHKNSLLFLVIFLQGPVIGAGIAIAIGRMSTNIDAGQHDATNSSSGLLDLPER